MNNGFFNITPTRRTPAAQRPAYCPCGLQSGCISPKMPVTGDGRMKILVLAEAPGEQEDARNTQLIGPAGKVLREALGKFGVDLDRDCRKTNAVRCRPPKNREPLPKEIAACAAHVWEEIKQNPPRLILLLGKVAVESFLHGRPSKAVGAIEQWRGFAIPDQRAGCWVCPMYHPSYILNSQRGRQIRGKDFDKDSIESLVFNRDLDHALSHLEKSFPRMTVPEIQYPKWPLDLMYLLRFEKNLWAIDYETSGLKPYARGHRIASVGVAWNDGCAAFPLTSRRAMREWKICLFSKAIGKIAHNMKFEHQWAAHCLGVETENWKWDTMQAAHILDNRQGITSLKRQAYLALGVDDWSTEDFSSDAAGFNSLRHDEPTEALLRYNALDAWYTMQLYKTQRTQFK